MMRTTLTLDDDVAALLERLQKSKGLGQKELVNRALRDGLSGLAREERAPARRHRTKSRDLGECLIPSLDDVSEALAIAEGEDFR